MDDAICIATETSVGIVVARRKSQMEFATFPRNWAFRSRKRSLPETLREEEKRTCGTVVCDGSGPRVEWLSADTETGLSRNAALHEIRVVTGDEHQRIQSG